MATNRNEYQEYFLGGKGGRCLGLTALPPSCADCLEIFFLVFLHQLVELMQSLIKLMQSVIILTDRLHHYIM